MLTKLIPSDIGKRWEQVRPLIEANLPPTAGGDPNSMANLLCSLLMGDAQMWAIADVKEEDGVVLQGFAITTFTPDDITKTKGLLIYMLYLFDSVLIRPEQWKEMLVHIWMYAQAKGCSYVSAYSEIDGIVRLASMLGAKKSTYIHFDFPKVEVK